MDTQKEYSVGDEVWIVRYPLAIRCKITEVDDYFRKQNPTSYLFYDVDEPIGHSLGVDELFDTKEEAFIELLAAQYPAKSKNTPIENIRQSTIDFIVSTNAEEDRQMVRDHFADNPYPTKKRGTDWFTVMDVKRLDKSK